MLVKDARKLFAYSCVAACDNEDFAMLIGEVLLGEGRRWDAEGLVHETREDSTHCDGSLVAGVFCV